MACAILNDLNTVQPLYVNQTFLQNSQKNITVITPNDLTNSSDTTQLLIDQVAFIVYGYNSTPNFTCQ